MDCSKDKINVKIAPEDYLTNYILKRYLNAGENNWIDIVNRVSAIYPPIREYILSKWFIPGGRTLSTLGTDKPLVPNCVTIDITDDLSNIFETMRRLMELTRRGSGIGLNFGTLRPAKALCKKFNAYSSGPVGFIHMLSVVMKTVQQQSRHGAFIGILPITHPDIISFINVKQNLKEISNFNLSVLITKDFMDKLIYTPNEQVKANFIIKHADGTEENISTINFVSYDENFVVTDSSPMKITYKELFDEVVSCAWNTGEPGILFQDNINLNNPLREYLGDITCCNPCGEIAMYENECCNLGSLNLSAFVDEINYNPLQELSKDNDELDIVNKLFKEHVHVTNLVSCVRIAIIYLNHVIDRINTEDKKVDEFVRLTRRLGLGIMGLHDMLIMLKLPYDSEAGRLLTKKIMQTIKLSAVLASRELTKKINPITNQPYNSFGERLYKNNKVNNVKILLDDNCTNKCNLALLTVAPNGSTSMLPNVSSGIEPYFSLGYYRLLDNATKESGLILNKQIKNWIMKNISIEDRAYTITRIISHGINSCDNIPQYIKEVFKTAQDIKPIDHVKMMAVVQSFVDNSISKTVNLPETATKEEVAEVFTLAHTLKIKGLTVYRDNCRRNVITSSLSKDNCTDGHCDI